VAAVLFPTAVAILVGGLDDLALDVYCLWAWLTTRVPRRVTQAEPRPSLAGPEKLIAVFVPLWQEHAVIGGMLEHNVAAIDYDNYHFFIGAYPNDEPTLEAVRDLEARFPHVHLAVCPHDGPTSKADCLNWIYQRMLLFEEHHFEERHAQRFEIVVTHDAEDLIHPQAFACINRYADDFDMVQIPVLPLRAPFPGIVHSIYCDEFAEWQIKDMPARRLMGSFVPSNGVGTGFTRVAVEKLATAEHNLIFEPLCLTEDYENGLRLHKLGCSQVFVPLRGSGAGMIATREFFPQTMRSAIRQRTRWITGIGLQSWERHGWRGSWPQVYWFWRDRKGLIGNPMSLLSNFLFFYGLLTWVLSRIAGVPWGFASHTLHPGLLIFTLLILMVQCGVRMGCAARIYGWAFALGVPVRVVFGNWINAVATFRAISTYLGARIRHQPLVWLKTEHAYPSRTALLEHKRRLGEILTGSGYVVESDLERALATQPPGTRLGEYLIQLGKITDEELYKALSLQQSVPTVRLEPWVVNANIARSLPRHVIRDWQVLPFRIFAGSMFLASPEIPTDEVSRILRAFTRLSLRFHLVTPRNFDELTIALL
jgi:bacteriophage N4 adsorption protein B